MRSSRLPATAPRVLASGVAVVLGLTLAACGGDDESAASTPSAAESAPGEAGDAQMDAGAADDGEAGYPPGFPQDIPLPEDATLRGVSPVPGAVAWRAMYTVSEDVGRLDRYSVRLADAGFQTDVVGTTVTGFRDDWIVTAVIHPTTVTVQVLSSTEDPPSSD